MADKFDTRAARYRMFGRYNAWANGRIASTIRYRRVSSPQEFEQQLAPALAHWFNPQTRHRGQVHTLLTALAGEAPELDLLFFQRLIAVGCA